VVILKSTRRRINRKPLIPNAYRVVNETYDAETETFETEITTMPTPPKYATGNYPGLACWLDPNRNKGMRTE